MSSELLGIPCRFGGIRDTKPMLVRFEFNARPAIEGLEKAGKVAGEVFAKFSEAMRTVAIELSNLVDQYGCVREQFTKGDRLHHAPERKRPKRIAKKLRKRNGAAHFRDSELCASMHWNAKRRPGKLETAMLKAQRERFDHDLENLAMFGDGRGNS